MALNINKWKKSFWSEVVIVGKVSTALSEVGPYYLRRDSFADS
jgi:hypothetical protein